MQPFNRFPLGSARNRRTMCALFYALCAQFSFDKRLAMQTPRSPFDQVGGMVYFARMLDKIRLSVSGRLRHDFRKNIGTGFDGRCTRYLHVDYTMLVDRVLVGGSDEEILEWCFANGRRLNQEEIFVWNQCMTKRGWKDDASEELEEHKKSSRLSHRSDLSTFFEFFEAEEGRRK